jgi:hypothetical protein
VSERALSFRAAQACELAWEHRCRCRCRGRRHGSGRFVAALPKHDPHAVDPARVTVAELEKFFVVRLTPRAKSAPQAK